MPGKPHVTRTGVFLSEYNGRREEQDTEDYHQGVITRLERGSEPGWEGGEGMSEGSVGKWLFAMFHLGNWRGGAARLWSGGRQC